MLDLLAAHVVGDAVGEDHFLDARCLDALFCGAAHESVAGYGSHAPCSVLLHQVGSLGDGAGCVNNVVDEDDVGIGHVADDFHAGYLVGLLACLVAEDEGAVQVLAVGACTLRAAHVGCGDDEVVQLQTLYVGQYDAGGVEVVNGHVEESLLLVGMQVHRDEACDAGHSEHVGHELGGDADAGLALAVLAGPSEVGDNGVDGACRSTFRCVYHEEQFHEVVGVGECALHEEDIHAADGLLEADFKLAVGEFSDGEVAQLATQLLADFLCQIT